MKQSVVNYIVKDLMKSSNYDIKMIYYMFDGNVPFTDIEPKIESYDITDDYKEQMNEEARRAKIKYRIIYWVLFLIIYFGMPFLLHKT